MLHGMMKDEVLAGHTPAITTGVKLQEALQVLHYGHLPSTYYQQLWSAVLAGVNLNPGIIEGHERSCLEVALTHTVHERAEMACKHVSHPVGYAVDEQPKFLGLVKAVIKASHNTTGLAKRLEHIIANRCNPSAFRSHEAREAAAMAAKKVISYLPKMQRREVLADLQQMPSKSLTDEFKALLPAIH